MFGGSVRRRWGSIAGLSVAVVALVIGTTASAVTSSSGAPDRPAQADPLAVSVFAPINPVVGSDGRTHLAYELQVINNSPAPQALATVEAVDPARGDMVLFSLSGESLTANLRLLGTEKPGTFAPGQTGFVFMDVAFDKPNAVPRVIEHRLTVSTPPAAPVQDPPKIEPPPGEEIVTVTTMFAARATVSHEHPVVIDPPLTGPGWVAAGGCCSPASYHRMAAQNINGRLSFSQRYAIDFVQLGPGNRVFTAPGTSNEQWRPTYGADLLAVAEGAVIRARDDLPDQTPPNTPASGITVDNVLGNSVAIDIGHGRFALYAHMKPGTVRVKVGDRVHAGQVIGQVGNSGNSGGAHLHFQISDGPAILPFNSLPYEFRSFVGQGVVTSEADLFAGGPTIDPAVAAGPHSKQLPLNLEVVTFPAPSDRGGR